MAVTRLINDHALGEGRAISSDGLGFETYAKILAESASKTEGPFTIGIFGEWGNGKTSLMRLIESKIKRRKNMTSVWFNAWLYEKDDHPIIPLIGTIIHSLEKDKSFLDRLVDGGQSLIDALRAIAYGFAAKYKVSAASLVEVEASFTAKDSIDRQDELSKDPLLEESLYFSIFERLSNLGMDGNNRIVVFIDDLDRCFPDKALMLLESIKLVLSQPGFIFVIGVSRSIIEGYIVYIYDKEYGIKNFPGYLYLDKLIQLPFYIPPHTERMEEFSNTLLSYLDKITKDKLVDILPIIAIALGSNPRAIVRFINNLLIDMAISDALYREKKIKQIELEYFAISRCMQQQWPHEFLQLLGSDELCSQVATWTWDKIYEFVKSESLEYSSLAKSFLSNRQLFQLLLQTKQGKDWLQNSSERNSAIYFLQTKRREFHSDAVVFEKRYSIHLSYVDEDIVDVKDIAEILIKNGIDVNIDKVSSLEASRAFGVCVSSNSKSADRINYEIAKAVQIHQRDNTYLLIPILLPGATHDMIPSSIQQFSPLDLKNGINDQMLGNLVSQLKLLGYA